VYAPGVAMHHPGGCPELRPHPYRAFPPFSVSFFHGGNRQEDTIRLNLLQRNPPALSPFFLQQKLGK